MAVNAQLLANEILTSTYRVPNATTGMLKLGQTIAKHIVKNAVIDFSWVAVNTQKPYNPDAKVKAQGKIKSMIITLTPGLSSNRSANFTVLNAQITAGAMVAPYMVNSPWKCSPGILLIRPIKIFVVGKTREDSMLNLSTQICTWIKTWVPPIPCAGMRSTYAGVATPVRMS